MYIFRFVDMFCCCNIRLLSAHWQLCDGLWFNSNDIGMLCRLIAVNMIYLNALDGLITNISSATRTSERCSTHWGSETHICVSKLATIGSDNGLSPGRRQAIIWTNAAILLIRPLVTNFSEILIETYTFSFKKVHLKCRLEMAAILSRPQWVNSTYCPGKSQGKCCCNIY